MVRLLALGLFAMTMMISPALAAEQLQVKGNELRYGDTPVRLQGVAVGDPLLARAGRPLSDYRTIAREWNANAVRISVHPGAWRDYGRLKAVEVLQQNVEAALDAGLFVILTWHVIGVPDSYYQKAPDGMVWDVYDSSFALAKDFWREMAWRFGKDGRVIFELWNEPAYEQPPKEGTRWNELKSYWLRLTDVIRRNDGKNVLLVTGSGWGYAIRDIATNLMPDENTAYAWHVYAGTDDNNPSKWLAQLDALQVKKPVVVTELGFEPDERLQVQYHGTAEGYGKAMRRLLDAQKLHYTAWCWHPEWTPRMLEDDWQTQTEYGKFVQETLKAVPSDSLVRP